MSREFCLQQSSLSSSQIETALTHTQLGTITNPDLHNIQFVWYTTFAVPETEPAWYTWRSTCRTFVYMTSFTWQAFTWRNYCMLHDFMKSISMKCICMIKVTNRWWNKTMIHINTQPNNIYMTTHKHEYHPHETKEQLYDVELHDVANTWFVSTEGGATW